MVKILSGKGAVKPVPHYLQIDMLLGKVHRGYVWGAERTPCNASSDTSCSRPCARPREQSGHGLQGCFSLTGMKDHRIAVDDITHRPQIRGAQTVIFPLRTDLGKKHLTPGHKNR